MTTYRRWSPPLTSNDPCRHWPRQPSSRPADLRRSPAATCARQPRRGEPLGTLERERGAVGTGGSRRLRQRGDRDGHGATGIRSTCSARVRRFVDGNVTRSTSNSFGTRRLDDPDVRRSSVSGSASSARPTAGGRCRRPSSPTSWSTDRRGATLGSTSDDRCDDEQRSLEPLRRPYARVNAAPAQARGRRRQYDLALAQIAQASGLRFVYQGTTEPGPPAFQFRVRGRGTDGVRRRGSALAEDVLGAVQASSAWDDRSTSLPATRRSRTALRPDRPATSCSTPTTSRSWEARPARLRHASAC